MLLVLGGISAKCEDHEDEIAPGENAAAMAASAKKRLLLTYAYLIVYILLSSGQIFFNKWVLSDSKFNFPYPVGLTLLHMVFSTVLCFLVVRVFEWVKLKEGMTYDIYISSVLPIGATFALTLWLGNTSYLYISVSFAQMLKAIMPVAVFLLGASFGLEELSMKMMGTMTIISAGVSIASYGEVNFNWIGVVYMMGGVVGEAFRLIFIELLLKRKGLKLDPIIMMYYVSPCSALCLFVPWLILEKPKMDAAVQWHFDPVIMTLNALCTFALNVSVFLVISHTSALTIRVAGVIKDWVVVLVSVYLFADAKLTVINIFGYVIAIFGVYLYNAQKLNEAAVTSASNSTQESQGLLGVSNTTQHKYKQSGIPEMELETIVVRDSKENIIQQ